MIFSSVCRIYINRPYVELWIHQSMVTLFRFSFQTEHGRTKNHQYSWVGALRANGIHDKMKLLRTNSDARSDRNNLDNLCGAHSSTITSTTTTTTTSSHHLTLTNFPLNCVNTKLQDNRHPNLTTQTNELAFVCT